MIPIKYTIAQSALLLEQVPSELSAAGAKRGVRFVQLARRPKAGQGLVIQKRKKKHKYEIHKYNNTKLQNYQKIHE